MAKRDARKITVEGHELVVLGTGWSSRISVLEPVRGTIDVHRAQDEFLGADWLSENGESLPISADHIVAHLEELDG